MPLWLMLVMGFVVGGVVGAAAPRRIRLTGVTHRPTPESVSRVVRLGAAR